MMAITTDNLVNVTEMVVIVGEIFGFYHIFTSPKKNEYNNMVIKYRCFTSVDIISDFDI